MVSGTFPIAPRRLAVALFAAGCASASPPPARAPVTVALAVPAVQGSEPTRSASNTVIAAIASDAGAAVTTEVPSAEALAQRHYSAAMEAFARGDYTAAARAFEACHSARPGVDFAFNAGRMYERLADVPNASRWYGVVLASNPDPERRADVTSRLASLRDFERRRREDIAQPPPGTDAMAREAAQWFQRGVALYQRRQYAQALRGFEAANQFVEGAGRAMPELMFNLAVTHEHLGHSAEAASAFRSYLAARPDAPDHQAIEERVRRLARP